MPAYRLWPAVVATLFLACESEPPPPPTPPRFGEAFSHLPLPPNPEVVSRAGGADALQITVYSPIEAAKVTEYYRSTLTKGAWRLVSDIKSPDGSTALYAEQDGPPLWVRIWKANDRPGTMIQLTGAVVRRDSTQPKQPSDSSTPPSARRG
jgi:hypothetical protein